MALLVLAHLMLLGLTIGPNCCCRGNAAAASAAGMPQQYSWLPRPLHLQHLEKVLRPMIREGGYGTKVGQGL